MKFKIENLEFVKNLHKDGSFTYDICYLVSGRSYASLRDGKLFDVNQTCMLVEVFDSLKFNSIVDLYRFNVYSSYFHNRDIFLSLRDVRKMQKFIDVHSNIKNDEKEFSL